MAPNKKLLIVDDSPLLARGILSRTTRDEDILFGVDPELCLRSPLLGQRGLCVALTTW